VELDVDYAQSVFNAERGTERGCVSSGKKQPKQNLPQPAVC